MTRVGVKIGLSIGTALAASTSDPVYPAFTPTASPGAFVTANPGGEAGPGTGHGYGVWLRVPGAVPSAVRHILNRSNSSNAGHVMFSTGTFGSITGLFADGGGVGRTPAAITISGGDVGKLLFVGHQHTGSVLRSFHNRAQSGSDVTCSGFAPHSSATGFGGTNAGFQAATGIDILGGVEFTGVPTVANWQAYYDALKSEGDIPTTFPGATVTHSWSVKRNYTSGLPTTLTDVGTPGGNNMTVTGTAPTLTLISGASWGW